MDAKKTCLINKFENNSKDLRTTILNISVLKVQLNNIDWKVFNFILVDNGIISIVNLIVSESQSF